MWKTLWTMWKSVCFQQVFGPFTNRPPPVEIFAYDDAYSPQGSDYRNVTSMSAQAVFSGHFPEIVAKPGESV